MRVRAWIVVAMLVACDRGATMRATRTPPPADNDVPPADRDRGTPPPSRPVSTAPAMHELPYEPGRAPIVLSTGGAGFTGRSARAEVFADGNVTFSGGHNCNAGPRYTTVDREQLARVLAQLDTLFDRDPKTRGCLGYVGCGSPDSIIVTRRNRTLGVARGEQCPRWITDAFAAVEELVGDQPCR